MFLTYFGQNNTETEQQHPFHPSFYTSTQEDNFWGCGVTHSIQLCPSLPQGLILLRLQCLIVGICVSLCASVHMLYLCGLVFVCVSSEGKMVVLSLAIGLAEQDDFANLPDLQEAPAGKENETTPDKR